MVKERVKAWGPEKEHPCSTKRGRKEIAGPSPPLARGVLRRPGPGLRQAGTTKRSPVRKNVAAAGSVGTLRRRATDGLGVPSAYPAARAFARRGRPVIGRVWWLPLPPVPAAPALPFFPPYPRRASACSALFGALRRCPLSATTGPAWPARAHACRRPPSAMPFPFLEPTSRVCWLARSAARVHRPIPAQEFMGPRPPHCHVQKKSSPKSVLKTTQCVPKSAATCCRIRTPARAPRHHWLHDPFSTVQ